MARICSKKFELAPASRELSAPRERVRHDVGEAPPQVGVIFLAEEHNVGAAGPANAAGPLTGSIQVERQESIAAS